MNHGCCTMLYDAVYSSAHEELAQQVGRKAMILLTDGEDDGSKLKLVDAIEAAQKADSIVYVLLCADRGFYGFGGFSGDSEMKKLTQETGGRVIDVGNKMDKLQRRLRPGRKGIAQPVQHRLRSDQPQQGRKLPQGGDSLQGVVTRFRAAPATMQLRIRIETRLSKCRCPSSSGSCERAGFRQPAFKPLPPFWVCRLFGMNLPACGGTWPDPLPSARPSGPRPFDTPPTRN